jgi:hypothetical protein
MKKLIKRKDGSYSQRGLWDNIRANKGSGKEPTKQMLKQESKIKKEESMNSMYKKGGKAPKKKMMKESFMEESKELHFGAPGVKPPMKKKMMGGKYENGGPGDGTTTRKNLLGRTITETVSNSGNDYTRTSTRKNGTTANSYSEKYTPGETADTTYNRKKFDKSGNIKKEKTDLYGENFEGKVDVNYKKGTVGGSGKTYGNKRQGIQFAESRPVIRKYDINSDENSLNGYGAPNIQKEFRREKGILKDNAVKNRASFKTGGSMFETMLDKLKVKGKKK